MHSVQISAINTWQVRLLDFLYARDIETRSLIYVHASPSAWLRLYVSMCVRVCVIRNVYGKAKFRQG